MGEVASGEWRVTSGESENLGRGVLAAAGRAGEVALVEGLADEGFDNGLAADVEFLGGVFQFFEHGGGEIDVDALDGLHHLSGVGEETRNVLAAVGHAGNGFGGERFFPRMRSLHKVSGIRRPPAAPAIARQGSLQVVPRQTDHCPKHDPQPAMQRSMEPDSP
jgi:hypothetical protein